MAYRLKMKQKQWLVAIHVLSIISWFGGIIAMFTLGLSLLYSESGEQLYYILVDIHLLDATLIRYPALVVLLTGILLSIWTQWGLLKHYWVLIKLVLTMLIIIVGILFLGDWQWQLEQTAKQMGLFSLNQAEFRFVGWKMLIATILNIIAMAFMTLITYLKPYGKIKKKKNER